MQHDLSDAILKQLSNYAVGFVVKDGHAGSRVQGSGTLVKLDGRYGILTAGHVAEIYEKLDEIGLVRFVAGTRQPNTIDLRETFTIIIQSSDHWSEQDIDLAFTVLTDEVGSSIEAQGVFLNAELNQAKMEQPEPSDAHSIDAMLGLVAEFSAPPFRQDGEVISDMRAVLHTGHIRDQTNALMTFDAMDYNLPLMPKSFGGMSGAGLWRVYFTENEAGAKIVGRRLCGVAAWQIDERQIACQGWGRIEYGLFPEVRKPLRLPPGWKTALDQSVRDVAERNFVDAEESQEAARRDFEANWRADPLESTPPVRRDGSFIPVRAKDQSS